MQVGSGGAGIWTRATCLHKHGLSLPLMSWALGVNVPTAFKLTSHHMACSKAFTLPKSTLACGYCLHTVLSLCWLVSSIHALSSHPETLSWGIIRTAPPLPSPMVHQCRCHISSTFIHMGPSSWASCTSPISGLLLPESTKPCLTWLPVWPLSKAFHFHVAINFSLKIQISSNHVPALNPHELSLPAEQNRNSFYIENSQIPQPTFPVPPPSILLQICCAGYATDLWEPMLFSLT